MEEQNNKNLILAMVLSAAVMLVWFIFFPPPEPPAQTATIGQTGTETVATAPAQTTPTQVQTEADPVPAAPRLTIDTPKLAGSLSLRGGRIDDLSLKTYRQELAPGSPIVRLLSPVGEDLSYYSVFGWLPGTGLESADVPDANTAWTADADVTLAPGQPVTLRWENDKGLTFIREVAVDADFMFTVTDTVQNGSSAAVALQPYGIVARHGLPKLQNIFVVHEGAVQRIDGKLTETDYADITELEVDTREGLPAEVLEASSDGWIGFTDHYWMTTLIPEQGKAFKSVLKYVPSAGIYQAEVRQPVVSVAPGATATSSIRFFAGAKEWATIRAYENEGGIPGFVDSIDWGWFYFLTKPIFAVLHWLNAFIGNMGLAIIALTFFLKFLVLPLAYKSYVSMARMKELQPEMEALKERAGEDKQKLQREMMQLYKDKKVNPAAGCLPILIQIPIFFALYKVIFVTIELRHAPFFGWLRDLSAPDPSSLYNFFGLLPWDAPVQGSVLHLIFIGILPILLGITMWLQQKLNPAPTDPVQASIFAWMPWVFMFMLGGFASGLVVYWIANNTITFVQQYLIMWSHGKRPDIFGNIREAKAARVAAKTSPKAPTPPAPAPKKGKK
ncbi:membrane protein insertase YidC [Tabrizicola sp.]|uniref:membrane protein insertase YidC n=1 Tax=Tabrizicola sp. TaxID=2005166 RepID=UPI002732D090|nr:membrane protein insertase YidC [Tabrizicola sp.]MDP3195257.1 membrane protein insertase YidC [Tabrizicola sp.]